VRDRVLSTPEAEALFERMSIEARMSFLTTLKPASQAAVLYSLSDADRASTFEALHETASPIQRAELRLGIEEYREHLERTSTDLDAARQVANDFL